MNQWLNEILENNPDSNHRNHQKAVLEVLEASTTRKSTKSELPPNYWLECYEKKHAEIREYESPDDSRTQAKREIFYAFVLREHPNICREFEALINTHME